MRQAWAAWLTIGAFLEVINILEKDGTTLSQMLTSSIGTNKGRKAAWILFCGWFAGHILFEE